MFHDGSNTPSQCNGKSVKFNLVYKWQWHSRIVMKKRERVNYHKWIRRHGEQKKTAPMWWPNRKEHTHMHTRKRQYQNWFWIIAIAHTDTSITDREKKATRRWFCWRRVKWINGAILLSTQKNAGEIFHLFTYFETRNDERNERKIFIK